MIFICGAWTLIAAEQDRPDVARRRAQWTKYRDRIDPSCLVFMDETWTKTNMARLRGWVPRGQRIKAMVPHGRRRTTTFMAVLPHDRINAPWFTEGPINGETFLLYVDESCSCSDLAARRHRHHEQSRIALGHAVGRAIRAVGARLFYLPAKEQNLSHFQDCRLPLG
jgi:DDE superfamily endonuclease